MQYSLWGIKVTDYIMDGRLYWRFKILNPFQQSDMRYRIGINEKLLLSAQNAGVYRFLIKVGQDEIEMFPPTKQTLKKKRKNKEFELKESKFEGSKPLTIYHFIIN